MKRPLNLFGSTSLIVWAGLLVVGILGLGLYEYHSQTTQALNAPTPSPTPNFVSSPTPSPSATPDPYAGWQTYTDTKAGFTLRYPSTVTFSPTDIGMDAMMSQQTGLTLSLNERLISSISTDESHGFDQATALKDQSELAVGQWGEAISWGPVPESKKVVKVGDTYTKQGAILGMHDICSTMFEYDLTFYRNGYQVIISLVGGIGEIEDSMATYFTTDTTDCNSTRIFDNNLVSDPDHTGKNAFFEAVAASKGSGAGQAWYDTYQKVAGSLHFQ